MNIFHRCSKCNSEMEEGFVLEMGEGNISTSDIWVAGKPEKSFFSGISLKGKDLYNVKTFRCITCGYLESYALEKK